MIAALAILSFLYSHDPADSTRGLKKLFSDAQTGYAERWALIVGINDYTPPAKKLKNAVDDAVSVKKQLVEKYGFADSRVFLLTDKTATQQAVNDALDTLCNKDKVAQGHCVLVFFAGHGFAEDKDTTLLLADTTYGKDKTPVGKKIKLGEVRRRLLDECPAKHKLLILDCCHAGNIFRLDGDQYDPRNPTPTDGTFAAPKVTQAIASTWGWQEAKDGDSGQQNSPFTKALVAALESIPENLPKSQYYFTTTTLFAALQSRMRENQSAPNQTAVCMWLDRQRQGEFHFFPDPKASFTPRFDRETMLLAMAPTTYGNWWADEVPWFMPGLRHQILSRPASNRSSIIRQLDQKQLRASAFEVLNGLEASANESHKRRAKHLRVVFGGGDGRLGSRDKEINGVIKELLEVVNREGEEADPLDLHYLAVLQHKQGLKDEAEKHYAEALKRYLVRIAKNKSDEDKKPPETSKSVDPHRPLYALCLADQATFDLVVSGDNKKAAEGFNAAWQVYAEDAPAPFKVYVRMKEAEAYRRLGYPGPTADRLRAAEIAISNADPEWTSPLAAATLKNFAWADMEQWNFKSARDKFEAAGTQLIKLDQNGRQDEYTIDKLHVEHGLAMVERFQGRPAEALRMYRKLTPEIARTIHELDDRRNQHNYVEVRYLLYARLVNSLQRQADCSLFAPNPDYAEAADDYRRALLEVEYLDDGIREKERVKLQYCRAIALAAPSAVRDLDRARQLYVDAEKVLEKLSGLPLQTELCRSIAFTLLSSDKPIAGPLESGPRVRPHAITFEAKCAELRQQNRTFDRDELERLMFGHRLLIEARILQLSKTTARDTSDPQATTEREARAKERYELLGMIDDLLRHCRQACRGNAADPDLLVYLRPYYELAFLGKLAAAPAPAGRASERSHPHAKELIEIAWEATHGVPYEKPAVLDPVLILFCCRGRGCFLLDAPGLGGRCYVVDSLDPASLRDPKKKLPPLPLELLNDLRQVEIELALRRLLEHELPEKRNQQLHIRWADPYHLIGYKLESTSHRPAYPKSAAGLAEDQWKLEDRKFPFELQWAMQEESCRRCPKEPKFRTHVRWELPSCAVVTK